MPCFMVAPQPSIVTDGVIEQITGSTGKNVNLENIRVL